MRSFSNALKWSYASSWGEKGFAAFFTFFLAALLGPQDFGIVSIALIYIVFLQMILEQGLATALIQRADLELDHLDAVFWVNLALSLVLVAASALLSNWWAALNHAPRAAAIISVLSLCIPIEALAIVQKSLLYRNMDFKILAARSNVSVLVGGVVGVSMAMTGHGLWSLVGQQIARDLAALGLLWGLSTWRPRFAFSWKHFMDLLGFSASTFVARLGLFADTYASSVVLGLLFGPVAVGLYRLADRMMNTVLSAATSSIQVVALPEFSRYQDAPVQLRKSALTCIRLSSMATLPALSAMGAASATLMAVIGPKWIPATNVLQVLCASGICIVFAYFTGPLLQALSNVRLCAVLEWTRTIIGIGLLLLAGFWTRNGSAQTQIMAIALSRFVLGGAIVMPVFLYLLMRTARISFRDLLRHVAPSLVASVGTAGSILLFRSTGWLARGNPLTLLACDLCLGGFVASSVLVSLDTQLRYTLARGLNKRIGTNILGKQIALRY